MIYRSSISAVDDFWRHLATPELPGLGAGERLGVLSRSEVEEHVGTLLDQVGVAPQAGRLVLATALLYHDHHDEAHDLVADATDSTGALIHGIVHRREPDFWNAKYWFRRCDMHPAYATLGARLSEWNGAGEAEAVQRLTLPGAFDPFAFVDACEAATRGEREAIPTEILVRIQHTEFEEVVRHLLQ